MLNNRTETSKVFLNGDGSKTLEAHIAPIHYKEDYSNKNEEWKDIDLKHTIETSEYIEYDRLPHITRIYKNKTGYETISRRTGQKFVVELNSADEVKTDKIANDDSTAITFEVMAFRVRLWKELKTEDAPKSFKWKVTGKNKDIKKVGDLYFREDTEAYEVIDPTKKVDVTTKKTEIDKDSFYWEESVEKTGVKIDTDVSYYSGAGDGFVFGGASGDYSTGWDDLHDATTADGAGYGYALDNDTGAVEVSAWDTDGGLFSLRRCFLPFDTSALPDGATISSATLSIYVTSKTNSNNDGDDWLNVVQTTQANTSALVDEDFDQCGSIDNPTEGATRVDIGNISTSAYNTWTLNATGIGWISKTGYTKLGLREGHDCLDESPTLDTQNRVDFYCSEESGTDNDPKLEITYTEGSGVNSERGLYIKGVSTSSSTRGLYIKGFLTNNSERNIYLEGYVNSLYSRESDATLGTDDSNLTTTFSEQDYTDVGIDNDTYVGLEGTAQYFEFLFKEPNANENNTNDFRITWKGKSTLAPSSSTVYLQIYNRNTESWATLDSDDSTEVDTKLTLESTINTDLPDYYDANNVISCRVYQEVS